MVAASADIPKCVSGERPVAAKVRKRVSGIQKKTLAQSA